MNIKQRKEGEVLIVEMSGRMTIGQGDAQARKAILGAIEAGETKILLDMGEVPMVDSAGLGELISVYTWAHRSNAAMKLMKISSRVREVLSITQMSGLFDIFDDQESAIASFC